MTDKNSKKNTTKNNKNVSKNGKRLTLRLDKIMILKYLQRLLI